MESLLWPQVPYFICYGYWTPQFIPQAPLPTKMTSWEKCGLWHQRNAVTPQTCHWPATQPCWRHWTALSLLLSLETEEVTADRWHLRESQMSICQTRGNQERQLPLSMQGVASHVLLAGAGTAYTRIPVMLGRCPRCQAEDWSLKWFLHSILALSASIILYFILI